MKTLMISSFALLVAHSTSMAAAWSQQDIDIALAIVGTKEVGIAECLHGSGTKASYDVDQTDLNKDGVNELVIRSFPKDLGKGATGCYGQTGQNVHLLIADPKGGWNWQFGFDMLKLELHQKSSGGWPDIELLGPGSCFPIWRHYNGQYSFWKVCDDDGRLIYADTARWIKEGAVPRDANEETKPAVQAVAYQRETNLDGPEFWHNDSLMVVDSKRGLIIYKEPKPSISKTIKPGDVLFRGEPWDMYDSNAAIRGTAYVFRKGCKPEPYQVTGGLSRTWHKLVLRGDAPVRKKGSCEVASYSKEGGNAELVFESDLE